jgi:hypothetical protein
MGKFSMQGKLYIVATPIGNLGDMSARAIEVLKEVDIIAAEDTRNTIKLLNHFEVKTPMTSYHEFNKIDKAYELVEKIKEGKNIALVSDAGMPAISDPGEDLVRIAYEKDIEITVIPGASAVVSALAISGLPTRRFCFEAFLPLDKKERKFILEELKNETRTIILYEAPHKLLKTLKDLEEVLGEDRKISLVREISKRHEEVIRTTLGLAGSLYNNSEENRVRGEFVLVIEGKSIRQVQDEAIKSWEELSIKEHIKIYEDKGVDRKEAMKLVAKDRGISKRDVYAQLI